MAQTTLVPAQQVTLKQMQDAQMWASPLLASPAMDQLVAGDKAMAVIDNMLCPARFEVAHGTKVLVISYGSSEHTGIAYWEGDSWNLVTDQESLAGTHTVEAFTAVGPAPTPTVPPEPPATTMPPVGGSVAQRVAAKLPEDDPRASMSMSVAQALEAYSGAEAAGDGSVAQAIGGALSGGGGPTVTVTPLSVTKNGTYAAQEGEAYSPVTVNVQGSDFNVKGFIDRSITTLTMPSDLTGVGAGAFMDCQDLNLVDVELPSTVTRVGDMAFMGLRKMKSIRCDGAITAMGSMALAPSNSGYAMQLESAMFPNMTSPVQRLFSEGTTSGRACASLTTVDLGKCPRITGAAFVGCSSLKNLILRYDGVCDLYSTDAFANTPFRTEGSGCKVYVPQSYVASYSAATNWHSLKCEFVAIEGSEYEL